MIKIKIIALSLLFCLVSCNNKSMKIARANTTIIAEMTDFSPAYIEKNQQGDAIPNDHNLIGNTNWVVSADRELSVEKIIPFLQKMTDKKYRKEGMHPDHKEIFFVYSDTLHKQNAYVKMPFREIYKQQLHDSIKVERIEKISKETLYNQEKIHSTNKSWVMEIDRQTSVEEFVNIMVKISQKEIKVEKVLIK